MVSGGGHDFITPGSEAWRIFDGARCERELVYYPRGSHDCFNVISDLRPRMVSWLARQLERHHAASRHALRPAAVALHPGSLAAEAVDADFADALTGEGAGLHWNHADARGIPARWRWWWSPPDSDRIEVVQRLAPGERSYEAAGSAAHA
jgi:hypothetical protein